MTFYATKRVLVTGGTGFLGSHVVNSLLSEGATVRVATRQPSYLFPPEVEVVECNLDDPQDCRKVSRDQDCCFHLAAFGWGLGANVRAQPELLTNNLRINTNMLDAAYREGVQRYLLASSSAVYNGEYRILDDEPPWDGEPHTSEHCFGWAKRIAELQAKAYYQHFGMEIAIVRPSNPYGPNDNFDLERAHVIPALMRRAIAQETPFTVWGTGSVNRSFIYAGDIARGMLLALEHGANCDPFNLASSEQTSIANLAALILELCGSPGGQIEFDTSKPEGHPGKFPTTSKALSKIGFQATVPLREGLANTFEWFRSQLKTTTQLTTEV